MFILTITKLVCKVRTFSPLKNQFSSDVRLLTKIE